MRISVTHPTAPGRLVLHILDGSPPWRVTQPGQAGEALLDPASRAFLAEGYPAWLRGICEAIDADRQLAIAIVAEVRRRGR
ncbi:MAG: hypothetical protein KC619_01235 [Myxococcales bacterium]|nr:hypothetical protein [Myxococcales bacterium]